MEVGLDPRHIVLDGEPAPPKRHSLQFSAHVCCGQTSGWIKIPLGRQDSVTDPKARLTETAHGELDGCIVWNAHNTVLGDEALNSNIHRSGMLRKDRYRRT